MKMKVYALKKLASDLEFTGSHTTKFMTAIRCDYNIHDVTS